MDGKPNVLLIATLDSKEVETAFIKERLEENGLEVYLLDASIRRTIEGGAHITPEAARLLESFGWAPTYRGLCAAYLWLGRYDKFY